MKQRSDKKAHSKADKLAKKKQEKYRNKMYAGVFDNSKLIFEDHWEEDMAKYVNDAEKHLKELDDERKAGIDLGDANRPE